MNTVEAVNPKTILNNKQISTLVELGKHRARQLVWSAGESARRRYIIQEVNKMDPAVSVSDIYFKAGDVAHEAQNAKAAALGFTESELR